MPQQNWFDQQIQPQKTWFEQQAEAIKPKPTEPTPRKSIVDRGYDFGKKLYQGYGKTSIEAAKSAGKFTKGLGEFALTNLRAYGGDPTAITEIGQGFVEPWMEAPSDPHLFNYEEAALKSLLGIDPHKIGESITKGEYGNLAGELVLPAALAYGAHRLGAPAKEAPVRGIPFEDIPWGPSQGLLTGKVPEPTSPYNVPRPPPAELGPSRTRGYIAPTVPPPDLPPPTRFGGTPSGRAADLQNPQTVNIFGGAPEVSPIVPLAEQVSGTVRTPRTNIGDPTKKNAVPPIESLPKVDTSIVAQSTQPVVPPVTPNVPSIREIQRERRISFTEAARIHDDLVAQANQPTQPPVSIVPPVTPPTAPTVQQPSIIPNKPTPNLSQALGGIASNRPVPPVEAPPIPQPIVPQAPPVEPIAGIVPPPVVQPTIVPTPKAPPAIQSVPDERLVQLAKGKDAAARAAQKEIERRKLPFKEPEVKPVTLEEPVKGGELAVRDLPEVEQPIKPSEMRVPKEELGSRGQVMSRERLDQLREQGWTYKPATLSQAWPPGKPNNPNVRVVQINEGMKGPYVFTPPIEKPSEMKIPSDKDIELDTPFNEQWRDAISAAQEYGINWHEYDDVRKLRQAVINQAQKNLPTEIEKLKDIDFTKLVEPEVWHRRENDPPEIAAKREKLASIVGEDADRTSFDTATVKEVSELHNELEEFDKLKDMKPSQMRVREGGYSGTDKGVVGPVIINPDTGRPNLAMGGADPQVLRQLGTSLYTKDKPSVLIQELMQNTIDEMKIANVQKPVRVAFAEETKNPVTNNRSKSIIFQDFGRGMTENQLYNEFSDVGKSGKRNIQGAAGGFGFAKAAPFLGGDYMRVESVAIENGKKVKYTFAGKPEEFLDQEVGVPLHSEVVSDANPTGMRIEVFFPKEKGFYSAKQLLETITEASPEVKDIETLTRYSDDTSSPTSILNKFTREGSQSSEVKRYHGKPLPTYMDKIVTPENESNIYYDLDNLERTGTKLVFLNNGVYYHSESQGASIHAMPHIPERIVIDIKSKVAEGHDKYPFPANRQGLNEEVKASIRKWIDDNVIDPARDAQKNELQKLYDNVKSKPGNKHVIIDSGEKYTVSEFYRFENSPAFKTIANHMGDLLEDLNSYFTPDELVGTVDKFGYRIADPGSGGMNLPNPSSSKPNLKNLVVINPGDALYTGFTSKTTYQYEPKELTPPEAARRFVHLIKHEFAHNLAREEGAGFTWAFSQVDTRFPKTTHYESQIFKALTDKAGNYVREIPELLREYIEARRRPESKEDILARQAASIKSEGGGQPKGISGNDKPDGAGAIGEPRPVGESPKVSQEEMDRLIQGVIEGGDLPDLINTPEGRLATKPEWWGKPAKEVTIKTKGKGKKFKLTEEQKLDYTEEPELPATPPKGPVSERIKPQAGSRFGGPPKPPKPPVELPPMPGPDEPFKSDKFGVGERVTPPGTPEGKSAKELLKEAADQRKAEAASAKPPKVKKEPVKKAKKAVAEKKAEHPVMDKPVMKDAEKSLPRRFRNNAIYEAIYEPIGVSSVTKLERLGPAGKELADLLRSERTESHRAGGKEALSTRKVMRDLSKKEQLEVAEIMDGQKPLSSASNQKVKDAYVSLRQSTESLGNRAVAADVRMRSGRGKKTVPFAKHKGEYWPRRYPKGMFKNVDTLRDTLLKKGKDTQGNPLSPAAVDAIIKQVTEKGERFSSAQHARIFDLPGYRMDLGALAEHQYEMARTITRAEKFGPMDVADPFSKISELIKKTSNPAKAQKIVNDYLGRTELGLGHEAQQRLYNAIIKAEVGTKLSQFGITNMGDVAIISGAMGPLNTMKAIVRTAIAPHKAVDVATQSGSLAILRTELMRDVGEGNLLGTLYGANSTEKLMRTVGTLAGRYQVQTLFRKAKKNPKKWSKPLEDYIDGEVTEVLAQDQLTPEQLDFAGGRGVELSTGIPDPLDLPKAAFADNPLLRLPYLFKRFAFLNTKNMVNAVRKAPTWHGKLLKAATIVGVYQVAGEVIGDIKKLIEGLASGDVKEAITGRGEFVNTKGIPFVGKHIGGDLLDRLMANFLQSALFGIVGDVTESVVRRPLGKASGTLLGPVGSDIDELLGIVGSASAGNYKPLGKAIARRIPYVGAGLEKRWSKEGGKFGGIPMPKGGELQGIPLPGR